MQSTQRGFTTHTDDLFIVVVIMLILAAIAIPAFLDYKEMAEKQVLVNELDSTAHLVAGYYYKNWKLPASLTEAGYQEPQSGESTGIDYSREEDQKKVANISGNYENSSFSIRLEFDEDRKADWVCVSKGFEEIEIPAKCR
jgi:Tfp pilus assembly protein PilE